MTIFEAKIKCPPIPNLTIPQFLLDDANHERTKGHPWLIDDVSGTTFTYNEVVARTEGLANSFHSEYGIGEDSIVCLFSPNHVDYPIAIWALHRLYATLSPANPAYTADELVYQIRTSGSTYLITSPASLSVALSVAKTTDIPPERVFVLGASAPKGTVCIDALIRDGRAKGGRTFKERRLGPGEAKSKIAFLSFSSGTTEQAVAIPHHSVIANVIQIAATNRIGEDYAPEKKRRYQQGDVTAAVLPFYHIYGLVMVLHFMLYAGSALVVFPKFSHVDFLKSIVRHKITHLYVVPPQVVLLCKHPETRKYDLSGLRVIFAGAAPLSAELTKQLIDLLPQAQVGQGYGMTETSTVVTMFPLDQSLGTLGSAGQLIAGCKARVVKEGGVLAGLNEEGELEVQTPSAALRYTNNAEATRDTFLGDSWVRTGDIVLIRENGDVFIVDRSKEILKVRGFQVAPAELEGHLLDHPAVADACVVGIPDEYSGEVPLAFVVLDDEYAKKAKADQEANQFRISIQKHVSDAKTRYKWLEGGVEFVDEIPKNPSGKLLRRLLRDKAKEIVASRLTKAKL